VTALIADTERFKFRVMKKITVPTTTKAETAMKRSVMVMERLISLITDLGKKTAMGSPAFVGA
jgi:hypothetical protein